MKAALKIDSTPNLCGIVLMEEYVLATKLSSRGRDADDGEMNLSR